MTAYLNPLPLYQFFGSDGLPLVGGKVYTYAAGTTTPLATYTDSTGLVQNANPIILDANGQALIWFGDNAYKMNLTDSNDVQQANWPLDNIQSETIAKLLAANLLDSSNVTMGDALVAVKQPFTGSAVRTQHQKNQDVIHAADWGVIMDGSDEVSKIQAAIDYVSSIGGGRLKLGPGVLGISSRINLKRGVTLQGFGMSDYTLYPTMKGTVIRPIAGYSDSHVILADSAIDSTQLLSGVGINDLTIDCINISTLANRIISLMSVTNAGKFKNISVVNLDDGFALSIDKSSFAGAFPSDGLIFEGFYTYGKTAFAATRPRLEIGAANEITFIGCKFQGKAGAAAGTVGASLWDYAHGVSFYDCSFAGCEIGVNIYDNAGVGAAPMFIAIQNCIFEGYRIGVSIDSTSSNPLYYPRRIFCSGNRFFSATGNNVRNYYVNKSADVMIIADDYVEAGSGGTSYIAKVDYAALGCRIEALPASCLVNVAADAVVYGRNGNALQLSALYREPTNSPTLATGWTNASPTNRTSAGYWKDAQGVVHLQGYVGYSSGGNSTIFTLPAGYVPTRSQLVTVMTNTGVGSVLIDQSTGAVNQLSGGTGWVSLDGVQFGLN